MPLDVDLMSTLVMPRFLTEGQLKAFGSHDGSTCPTLLPVLFLSETFFMI